MTDTAHASVADTRSERNRSVLLLDGAATVDELLARELEAYGALIQHAGHAKLRRALIVSESEPSYRDLSRTQRGSR